METRVAWYCRTQRMFCCTAGAWSARRTQPFTARGGAVVAKIRGFTLVELIVVIAVIALILAFAIPALNNMSGESKLIAGVQTVNGALTRAYYASQADRQLSAVRFLPGEWDFSGRNDPQSATGRQHLVPYTWVTATDRENSSGAFELRFREQFQRRPGSESIQLPPDIWVAPVEAWRDDTLGSRGLRVDYDILSGRRGQFELSANRNTPVNTRLLNADDFMIVFDSQTGLKTRRELVSLRGYDPTPNVRAEVDDNGLTGAGQIRYERFTSAGVVVYRREPFAALGDTAAPEDRQRVLRTHGRAYFVHRYGGGLVLGTSE